MWQKPVSSPVFFLEFVFPEEIYEKYKPGHSFSSLVFVSPSVKLILEKYNLVIKAKKQEK